MPMIRPTLVALALCAFTGLSAQARDLGTHQQELQAACSGDYIRLCAGIDPNGSEVEACFKRNMAKVSPDCRAAINGYQGRPGAR